MLTVLTWVVLTLLTMPTWVVLTMLTTALLTTQAEEASAIARQKRRAATPTLTPSPNPLLLPVTPNPINSKPQPYL